MVLFELGWYGIRDVCEQITPSRRALRKRDSKLVTFSYNVFCSLSSLEIYTKEMLTDINQAVTKSGGH